MRRKDFTISEKQQVIQFLVKGSYDGKMAHGRRAEAVIKFSSSTRTITRIWAASMKQQKAGEVISLQSRKVNRRAKRVHIDLELISSLELQKRSTIRKLAQGVNCSKSTVGRWIKCGLIKAHTSAIRPDLTAPNKLLRLRFSLEALELDRIMHILRFKSMRNTMHIDEKWFYMTKGMHRPIFGPDGSVMFDGKIGIFPFTQKVPAQRSSKTRSAETMETKAIQSVTKEVVRDCLINQIIPAIKEKWPTEARKHIYIQQDNAKPHIKNNDPIFREAAIHDGFVFTLIQQPPNSPDTNMNDLGWFRAIQSIQTETVCHTIDQLVQAVVASFQQLTPTTLNNVFLSLQGCMVEIMKVKGENRYKLPHMGKEALIRAGTLPHNLEVPQALVRECIAYLLEARNSEGLELIRSTLDIEMVEEEMG